MDTVTSTPAALAPKARGAKARLEALRQRREEMAAQAAELQSSVARAARKADTRENVVVGSTVLAAVRRGLVPRPRLLQILDEVVVNDPTRAFLRERGWAVRAVTPPEVVEAAERERAQRAREAVEKARQERRQRAEARQAGRKAAADRAAGDAEGKGA